MAQNIRPWILFLLLGACGAAQAQWLDFKWGVRDPKDPVAGQHGALLLPVTLAGAACWMQLDTGFPVSVLYRPSLPAAIATGAATVHAHLSVGALAESRDFTLMYPDDPHGRSAGCPETNGGLAGTLGNDVLLGSAIELDLSRTRFRIWLDKGAPPPASANEHVVPFVLEQATDGKIPVVSAQLPDGRAVRLMFDTGSAFADLLVFRQADWLALVGPAQAAHATRMDASSWGHAVSCLSAPVQGTIQLHDLALAAGSTATYCALPDGPAFAGNPEYGTLGLKPFYQQSLLIDFRDLALHIRAPDLIPIPSRAAP